MIGLTLMVLKWLRTRYEFKTNTWFPWGRDCECGPCRDYYERLDALKTPNVSVES